MSKCKDFGGKYFDYFDFSNQETECVVFWELQIN